jgi:hypothetical protein
MTYMQIRAQIEQLEAGKKMEAQRNIDLAEAAKLYADALKQATSSATGALNALSASALNMVQGYKLQATIFGAIGASGLNPNNPTPIPTGGGGRGRGGGGGDLTVPLVLDGKVVAQVVLANFRSTAQKTTGDSTQWSSIKVVS